MPRGDKDKYTDKEKRQARHIEEGYEKHGVSEDEARLYELKFQSGKAIVAVKPAERATEAVQILRKAGFTAVRSSVHVNFGPPHFDKLSACMAVVRQVLLRLCGDMRIEVRQPPGDRNAEPCGVELVARVRAGRSVRDVFKCRIRIRLQPGHFRSRFSRRHGFSRWSICVRPDPAGV